MHLFCHDHPETLGVETQIVDFQPGRIALAQSPCMVDVAAANVIAF
jgi:misacylated tRNA(Ala) deacylase